MSNRKEAGLKFPVFAALALSFASCGDAFLYAFIPLNFSAMGISAAWVGLILSVNRFVRIFSNGAIVHLLARFGLRPVMIVAAVIAVLSTFGYGLATGITLWLVLRVAWGLSYSAMRIGTAGYALQHEKKGRAFGLTRGIQEAGPMTVLFMASGLTAIEDTSVVFCFLSGLSLPAIYFALKLPAASDAMKAEQGWKGLQPPSVLNAITFVCAMVIDGMLVVLLGILFLLHNPGINITTATALAAACLAFRRICAVVLSVAGGWVSDKVGMGFIFRVSFVLVIAGLCVIIAGWVGTGTVMVFACYSIHSAITPGYVSLTGTQLGPIAENATWRDLGAAAGTLVGGLLVSSQYLNTVLATTVLIMVYLLAVHAGMTRNPFKLFYLWK